MALIIDKTRYHVVSTGECETESNPTPIDFETAVSATGFGVFNVLLLLAVIPAGWSTAFDISTTAFIIPSAECDFDLNLLRKGILTGATYAGIMCTTIGWRFIADHFGRKYLLLFGLMFNALCNILGSASQSYYIYLSLKFFTGIIVGGLFATLLMYVAEFHGERHRARILMWTNFFIALGNIAVPALARVVLPQPWTFSPFRDSLIFTSWRIFLIICGLPHLLGFFTLSVFPESPKYLMAKGRPEEAFKIFRTMYSMNTGKLRDDYPVKALSREHVATRQTPSEPTSRLSRNDDSRSLSRTKNLFAAPYLLPLFIVSTILFAGMTGMHVMKSWLPQLIVILNNFDPKESNDSLRAPTICEKLDVEAINSFVTETPSAVTNGTETCTPMIVSTAVYTNATIIAASAVLGSFLAGILVNKVGKKGILLLSLASGGGCYFGLIWSTSTTLFLVLSSACVGLTGISTNTITAMMVEIFPAKLRAEATSVTATMGQLGALTGNLLFPILLEISCDTPFYYIGGFLTLGFVLGFFLFKYTEKVP